MPRTGVWRRYCFFNPLSYAVVCVELCTVFTERRLGLLFSSWLFPLLYGSMILVMISLAFVPCLGILVASCSALGDLAMDEIHVVIITP